MIQSTVEALRQKYMSNLLARSLRCLGNIPRKLGRYEDARTALSEGSQLCQDSGDQMGATKCLNDLGVVYYMECRYADAEAALQKASVAFEQLHDLLGRANCLKSLGDVYLMQDRLETT